MATPYAQLKHLAARAIRPGLLDLTERVAEVQGRAAELERRAAGDRETLQRLLAIAERTRDHSEELGFWRWLIKTEAGRASLFAPFEEAFGQWQRDRLRELAGVLGLARGGDEVESVDRALDAWCARQRALEIGGGPFPALAAAPAWRQAIAVDPLARQYVEEGLVPACGNAASGLIHLAASGEAIPLPSATVDLVIIENALDHVTDPGAVVREAHRLLRPGGLLWLLVDLSEYSDAMHPHPFSLERARALLSEAGFECVHDRTSDHHSHPKAHGEYRALVRKAGAVMEESNRAVSTVMEAKPGETRVAVSKQPDREGGPG